MSEVTEAELKAKAVAPRVTLDQINALNERISIRFEQPEGTTSTFAHAYLGAFYVASGHSACVSLENFDKDLGQRLAERNARAAASNKLWELEGYALFKSLNPAPTTHMERVQLEQNVLAERLGKLQAFMDTDLFRDLPVDEQDLLDDQLAAMALYNQALLTRILRSKASA